MDNNLISRSPVRDRHTPRVTRHEKPVWSAEQLKLIVDSVPKTHSSLFQCAMLTGARLGELQGFQWKNVNFESQTLEIRQALWEGELVAPKTEGSIRVIYLGPWLLSALTAQKQNSNHGRQDDFVFCKDDGSYPKPRCAEGGRALSDARSPRNRSKQPGCWLPHVVGIPPRRLSTKRPAVSNSSRSCSGTPT